jgi:predicted PurR-regulated permease PerM
MAADTPPYFFTPTQRRVISAALLLLAVGAAVALVLFAFVLLGRFVGYFAGVLWPLAVAGVLALILRPVVAVLERRLRLHRSAAVVLLYGIFVLLSAATLFLLLPPLFDQFLDFLDYAPLLWKNGLAYLEQHYPQWIALLQRQLANPTIRQLADALTAQGKVVLAHAIPSLSDAGGGLVGVFAFFTHLAIIPVYLFFLLLAGREPAHLLHPELPFLSAGLRDDVVFLVREFTAIVASFFRGQLLIGLIMGVLLAVGFTLIGLKFGLILGLVIGVLNIVPYLGTILGLAITLPLAFLQPGGSWSLVFLVLVVKIVVQAVEGWVLTPKIMGAQTGLHPVMIIFAIFFWGTAFNGVLGMLLAIPLTAFFVTAWRLAKRKYLPRPA